VKLGVVESLVKGPNDAAAFLQAKRLGLEGIEVILTRQQLREPEQSRLKTLKNAQAQSQLEIPSLMMNEHNRGGIASSNAAVAQAAMEDIRQAIEWAVELGAKVILVPFFGQAELVTAADLERVVQSFRNLCPLALERGVKLCYEGLLPARDVLRLARQIDSEAFGCYFDMANIVWRGLDTALEIQALGNLTSQVHMKDIWIKPGDCAPGLGRVNFPETAKALADIGYEGWMVLETPIAPLGLVARDISFTRFHFPVLREKVTWPQVGTFSWGFKLNDLDRMIERFKEYGLTAVQIAREMLQDALDQPDAIPGIQTKLEANGIVVTGLGAYRNLVTPDPAKRQANIAFVKRCLEVAPLFGTEVVATEAGTRHPTNDWLPVPENWSNETWELFCSILSELLPVAEQAGSILTLESFVNNILQTPGQLLDLMERFPSKHLQFVIDPYNDLTSHLLPAAERISADWLNRFEHRFVLVHLKDVSSEGAEVDTPEFGQGVYPHKLFLDFLRTRRPDLPLIIEHLPFDHIPAAIRLIHKIVDE
jgi:sugar phosphate isomerase/epimerase